MFSQRTRNTDQIKLHISTLNTQCSEGWFWRIITFPVTIHWSFRNIYFYRRALNYFWIVSADGFKKNIWNCAACEKCTFHWCWTNSVIRKGMNFKPYCKKQLTRFPRCKSYLTQRLIFQCETTTIKNKKQETQLHG